MGIGSRSLTVVGSVALDTVRTPFGIAKRVLGGSAVYFSCAARFFCPVHLVGAVGRDFPAKHKRLLSGLGIDTRQLTQVSGKTFFWEGYYDKDLNRAHSLKTELNVFGDFKPVLPEELRKSPYLFLANIHPALQMNVLKQMRRPVWTASDTMNFWIESARPELLKVLRNVDISLMNDAEIRQLTGEDGLPKAVKQLLRLGPSVVVVKRGEFGAAAFTREGSVVVPAVLLESPKDPTGAGDSFAGAFLGSLAGCKKPRLKEIGQALAMASVVASFNVESFSVRKLCAIKKKDIARRHRDFLKTFSILS